MNQTPRYYFRWPAKLLRDLFDRKYSVTSQHDGNFVITHHPEDFKP